MSRDERHVHEPVPGVKLWTEKETIRLLSCTPEGDPVELDAAEASGLADLLRTLSEPGFPDPPYEAPASGYGALMHSVCAEWGYCGSFKDGRPLHVDFLIPPEGPVTADQFVEWVFLAENMNPNVGGSSEQYKAAIRAAFVKHMGGEVVDARQLRWVVR